VLIDLTMIGDFTYYTGMTFEGYAADLGFPVCSGGRYDNLLKQFDRPAAATGFALKTNRMLEVADVEETQEPYRVLVLYVPGKVKEALACAQGLRTRENIIVETARVDTEAAGSGVRLLDIVRNRADVTGHDEVIEFG
jgi:ATP phosphoribosyltransferase regulatory subunit